MDGEDRRLAVSTNFIFFNRFYPIRVPRLTLFIVDMDFSKETITSYSVAIP